MTGISQNSLDGLEGFDRIECPSARSKPVVVFVDDEQRVLNSMRALFRRDYEVHLTTQGAEAIAL